MEAPHPRVQPALLTQKRPNDSRTATLLTSPFHKKKNLTSFSVYTETAKQGFPKRVVSLVSAVFSDLKFCLTGRPNSTESTVFVWARPRSHLRYVTAIVFEQNAHFKRIVDVTLRCPRRYLFVFFSVSNLMVTRRSSTRVKPTYHQCHLAE